jgi:chromate transport protein ChrA
MMRGVNAAVVGLLGAALYSTVWTSAIKAPGDFGIALVGFVLLTVWRAPPLLVVVISALGGIALAMIKRVGYAPFDRSLLGRPFAKHVPSGGPRAWSPIFRRRCFIPSCPSF